MFAKNDTIVLLGLTIIPESKEYFMDSGDKDFFELIFDENDEVLKMVASSGSYRQEFKKID